MRMENKFNGYRYKTYPTLVRGSEGDPDFDNYANILHDVEFSRNRSGYNVEWYKFTFFVFVQRPMSDSNIMGSEPMKIDLMMEYEMNHKLLKVWLRSYHHFYNTLQPNDNSHGYTDFHFNWENLLDDGMTSIEEVVNMFEHCFLEVPLVQSVYNPTGINYPIYYSNLLEQHFSEMYNRLKKNYIESKHNQSVERSLAIATINHKRLAQNSPFKFLPDDTLRMIHSMATNTQKEDFTSFLENTM